MRSKDYRLFFAIELEPSVKTQLFEFQHSISELVAKPIPGENFHLTLSFLGKVSEKKLELILDHLSPLNVLPFEVTTSELIYWSKPKIVALSVDDPENRLSYCKKAIEKQLVQNDFFQLEKRKFVPHVSLFRQVELPPEYNQRKSITINVSSVSLMVSQPKPGGVYYDTLDVWPLRSSSVKQQLLGR